MKIISEKFFSKASCNPKERLYPELYFSKIFNSGQCWKFQNMEKLRLANEEFLKKSVADTNLGIIQRYFDKIPSENVDVIFFEHWLNCNTREDYREAKKNWRENNEKF